MPKRIITESEIRKLASKYVHTVKRDPNTITNIQGLITEALRSISPDRKIETEDVGKVIDQLSKRGTISDKIIHEAAKKVIDQGAMDDLRYMIQRNIKALGPKGKVDDTDDIIKFGKLNPNSSSLQAIKQAVQGYYAQAKPLESMSPAEIRDRIKAKMGGASAEEIRDVLNKYLNSADQDKPFNDDEVQEIINSLQGSPSVPVSSISRGREVEKSRANPTAVGGGVKDGGWIPPKDVRNPTFFEKTRLKMRRYGIKSLTRGSRNWLTDSINKVKRGPSRQSLMKEGETLADALVGKMFMYFYDAKLKKELPYWDKFPLIFVVELYHDGWLGLNVHYLPLPLRLKLFDKLLQFANDKSLDKVTKLRLSYQLIKNVSQFPEVRPTIKRYLSSQVRSTLVKVEPIDWEIALFLPVEQFQKEKKEHVWAESKKMVQKLKRRR